MDLSESEANTIQIRHIFGTILFITGTASVFLIGEIPSDSDRFENLLYFILLYGIGLGLFTWGFGRFQKLQLVSSTPTSKIRSMAKGNVQVKGKAQSLGNVLKTPFSQKNCIYYKYEVKERRKSSTVSRSRRRWVTIDQGEEHVKFGVDDGTGIAIVDGEGADFDLPLDEQTDVSGREDPPQKIQEFIENNENVHQGSNGLISFTDNRRKYREWYITPGEDLYIYGYADSTNVDGENFHLIKNGGAPLFYISDQSEEDIKKKWSWTYKAMILGGILLTPASYYLMATTTAAI